MKKAFSPSRFPALLFGLFVAFALCLTAPGKADAQNIIVTNSHSHRMVLAVVAKPVNRSWIVKGWWTINPHSTRELVFNNISAGSDKIYIHAHTSEASWGTEKRYTVIKSSFEYPAGQRCPNGDGRRQVGFDCYYFDQAGYLYLKF